MSADPSVPAIESNPPQRARDAGVAARGARQSRAGIDRTALGWLVLIVAGLGGFLLMTVLMLQHVAWSFDQPILDQVRPWAGDGTIWRVISESANIPLIVIGVGMVLVLFATHHRREAILVAIVLIAVTAGSEGVKQLVARPRPEGTDPNIPGVVYSYPSGHVLEVLTIFGIIASHVVRSRASRVVAALVVVAVLVDAFLVGLSRVVLNAHYPSDAVASFIGGLGVLGVYGLLTHDGSTAADGGADRGRSDEPAASPT